MHDVTTKWPPEDRWVVWSPDHILQSRGRGWLARVMGGVWLCSDSVFRVVHRYLFLVVVLNIIHSSCGNLVGSH